MNVRQQGGRPRGAGGEAQRGCGAPAGVVTIASVMGGAGVGLAVRGAAVRGGGCYSDSMFDKACRHPTAHRWSPSTPRRGT